MNGLSYRNEGFCQIKKPRFWARGGGDVFGDDRDYLRGHDRDVQVEGFCRAGLGTLVRNAFEVVWLSYHFLFHSCAFLWRSCIFIGPPPLAKASAERQQVLMIKRTNNVNFFSGNPPKLETKQTHSGCIINLILFLVKLHQEE